MGVISLSEWHFHVISVVAAASTTPSIATKWIDQAFNVDNPDQLVDPPEFESLSLKLANAAYDICTDDLKREVQVMRDQCLMVKHQLLGGRIIIWLIMHRMRLSDVDNVFEITDLQGLTVKGDNLEKFKSEWTRMLQHMRHPPTFEQLESVLRRRLEDSPQFKLPLAMYNQAHPGLLKDYQTLWQALCRHLEEKHICENRNAHENRQRGRTAAPIGSKGGGKDKTSKAGAHAQPVSYTHLTLPTNREV